MNQYQQTYSAEKVEGYFLPSPLEHPEATFKKAKAETIKNYEVYLRKLHELTFEQFLSKYPRYHRLTEIKG